MNERLNKYLAFHLGISRREADALIEHGHVKVDGEKAILGSRITDHSAVTVKNQAIEARPTHQTILLHKPIGYVSSRRRQGETPTIYELIPKSLHHLKPVGRLDKESTGLLLMTDDGDFAFEMTHPKFYKVKKYEISLDRDLEPLHQQIINDHGVQLEDGPSKLILEKVSDDRIDWIVTMHEGRNRQIRRTFAALGYRVTRLHRTGFGKFSLDELKEGSYLELSSTN